MGGGDELLRPALDGEGRSCGQQGGDEECGEDARGPVNEGVFEDGQAGGHEESGEGDLKDRQLLEAHVGREVREGEHVE